MKNDIKLSLIVPVFNAEKFIVKNLIKLQNLVNEIEKNFEIIVINDGSNDSTIKRLKYFKKAKKIKIFNKRENLGKGAAIKLGLKKAFGEYLIFIDCDLPYLSSLPKIYFEIKNKYDIAIATREKNLQKRKFYNLNFFTRRVISTMLSKIINIFIVKDFPDTQAGLKGFKGKHKRKILTYRTNKFLFDVEILRNAKKNDLKLKKIYVRHYPSNYTEKNLTSSKFYFFVLRDLLFILILIFLRKI